VTKKEMVFLWQNAIEIESFTGSFFTTCPI
jgi:hypothetical protein